jgi:hypothetical protein
MIAKKGKGRFIATRNPPARGIAVIHTGNINFIARLITIASGLASQAYAPVVR